MVACHSWLDCVKWKNTRCEGYGRSYPGRIAGSRIDERYTYQIQGRRPDAFICKPANVSQQIVNYTSLFPMAEAEEGDLLTFTYTPNGHVTIDPNPNPKNYTIHWSGKPEVDLVYRRDLNSTTQIGLPKPFDDGECGENRTYRSGRPCRGNFTIPFIIAPGRYQFIWWWIFDRDSNGPGEEYTTCFDVLIRSSGSTSSTNDEDSTTNQGESTTGISTSTSDSTGIGLTSGTSTTTGISGESSHSGSSGEPPDTNTPSISTGTTEESGGTHQPISTTDSATTSIESTGNCIPPNGTTFGDSGNTTTSSAISGRFQSSYRVNFFIGLFVLLFLCFFI